LSRIFRHIEARRKESSIAADPLANLGALALVARHEHDDFGRTVCSVFVLPTLTPEQLPELNASKNG
jgi:hypothetical protein